VDKALCKGVKLYLTEQDCEKRRGNKERRRKQSESGGNAIPNRVTAAQLERWQSEGTLKINRRGGPYRFGKEVNRGGFAKSKSQPEWQFD